MVSATGLLEVRTFKKLNVFIQFRHEKRNIASKTNKGQGHNPQIIAQVDLIQNGGKIAKL